MSKLIALSYSRLSTYEQCPKKFFAQFVDKSYPDQADNFHFVKGKKKHDQLDNYVKSRNDPTIINMVYDGDVQDAIPKVDELINSGFRLQSELKLAVDIDFKPCGWFDGRTAFRAILDVVGTRQNMAAIIDWKTGKFRDYDGSETGQLHLSSAISFATYPEIEDIVTSYMYIEHMQSVVRKFTKDMYNNGLCDPFLTAYETVNNDKEFAPTRNQYCDNCLIKEGCEAF